MEHVNGAQAIHAGAKRPADGNNLEVGKRPAGRVALRSEHDDADQRSGNPLLQLPRVVELSLHRLRVEGRTEKARVAADLHDVKRVPVQPHGVATSCTGQMKIG